MNKNMMKLLALALAALIPLGSLGTAAAAGVGTPSDLPPVVSEEPAAATESAEMPIENEESAAAPEVTQAPAETEPAASPEVTAAPEPAEAPAEVETVDVTATVVWKDNSNAQGIRPKSVKVTVEGSDGSKHDADVKDRPLDGEDKENFVPHDTWKQTFCSLPKTSGESGIKYSVSAKAPDGYKVEVSGLTVRMILKETENPAPETTEAPAEETEQPDEEAEAPAEESEQPDEEAEAPAEESEQPDEEAEAPVEETEQPDEETEAPVEETEQPDEEAEAPVEETEQPDEEAEAPAKVENLESLLDPNRSIDVNAEWEGDTLYFGDEMTLNAVLHGYDNAVYTLQWQVSKDGKTWSNVEGATETSTSILVTEENYRNYWRVEVTITDVITTDAE